MTLAAFAYGEERVRSWALAFKHGSRPDLAAPMARASWDRLPAQVPMDGKLGMPGPGDWLVPVPLHPARLLERGYDQAALYAAELSRLGAGRVLPLLRRQRWTPPQGGDAAPSRRANVAGAFRPRVQVPMAHHRTVWIVDDVMTSGATARASALALRRAGLRDIRVLCFARA